MAQRLNAWTPRHDLKELHLPARPSLPLTLLSANLATRILSSSNKLFACFFFFTYFYLFIGEGNGTPLQYLVVLGFCCCMNSSLVAVNRGYTLVAVQEHIIGVAFLVA